MRRHITYGLLAIAVGATSAELVSRNEKLPASDSTYNIQFPTRPLKTMGLFRGQRESLPAVEIGKNHELVKEAFYDVVQQANQITVRIMVSGKQVALGTLLSNYIVTKASQLEGHKQVTCRDPDGNRFDAKVVYVDQSRDLALLRYETKTRVVTLRESNQSRLGSWLVTTDAYDSEPLAISIVSTPARPVEKEIPILGIELDDGTGDPQVTRVFEATAAESAGLRAGDSVTHVNGTRVRSRRDLQRRIRSHRPGDRIQVKVWRAGEEVSLTIPLGRISQIGSDPSESAEFGGPLSDRRSDFSVVIQHDALLRPNQCGGPVVNLNGQLVGINIARASRVASYILPIAEVHHALDQIVKSP